MVCDASNLRRGAAAGFCNRRIWSIKPLPGIALRRQPAGAFPHYSPRPSKVECRRHASCPQIVGQHCCTAVQLGAFLAGMALARVENSGQHGSIGPAEQSKMTVRASGEVKNVSRTKSVCGDARQYACGVGLAGVESYATLCEPG